MEFSRVKENSSSWPPQASPLPRGREMGWVGKKSLLLAFFAWL